MILKKNAKQTIIKTIKRLSFVFSFFLSFYSVISIANESVVPSLDSTLQRAPKSSSELSLLPDTFEYPAAFFEQYTPQNAMDMINRLPGFSFDRGSNARGFGGNAGNVLIDGARPTSKSGGLSGALSRISAAQVESIIILRGGTNTEYR